MLDISVAGEIFAAPGPPKVLEALRKAKRDAGILFIVLNHAGDVLSANVAAGMAEKEGIRLQRVLTHEDISGGPRETPEERRGLVGCLPVIKVAGAAAEQGRSLEDCAAIAERMEAGMATLAVAVSGATHPSTGDVIAEIPDGMMVVGMGQHGEAGGGTQPLKTADATAEIMLETLLDDIQAKEWGGTVRPVERRVHHAMELYLVLRRVKQLLDARITLARSLVGEFLTVQEMGGFQMCIGRSRQRTEGSWSPRASPAWTVKWHEYHQSRGIWSDARGASRSGNHESSPAWIPWAATAIMAPPCSVP